MIIPREGTIYNSRGFPNSIQVSNELIQSIFSTQMIRIKDSHPIPPADYLSGREQ